MDNSTAYEDISEGDEIMYSVVRNMQCYRVLIEASEAKVFTQDMEEVEDQELADSILEGLNYYRKEVR